MWNGIGSDLSAVTVTYDGHAVMHYWDSWKQLNQSEGVLADQCHRLHISSCSKLSLWGPEMEQILPSWINSSAPFYYQCLTGRID